MNESRGDTYIGLESCVYTEEYNGPDELSHEKLLVEAFSDISTVDFIRQFITLGHPHVTLIVQILRVKSVRIIVLAIGHFCVKHVIILCSLCRRLVCLVSGQMRKCCLAASQKKETFVLALDHLCEYLLPAQHFSITQII